jgi:hypothetical protein
MDRKLLSRTTFLLGELEDIKLQPLTAEQIHKLKDSHIEMHHKGVHLYDNNIERFIIITDLDTLGNWEHYASFKYLEPCDSIILHGKKSVIAIFPCEFGGERYSDEMYALLTGETEVIK